VTSFIGTHPMPSGAVLALREHQAALRVQEAASLAGQIDSSAVQRLIGLLGDEHPFVRWQAGVSLADTANQLRQRARAGSSTWDRQSPELTYSGLLTLLRDGLQDSNPQRREATADMLGLLDHEVVVGFLVQSLEDDEAAVRASAAGALGRIADKSAVNALIPSLSDPSVWVRRAAADALGAIADPCSVPALQLALSDRHPLVRASAVCALGHINVPRSREMLERCCADPDATVRWYAARALCTVGTTGSLPALEGVRGDDTVLFGQSTGEVADLAMEAIERRESGPWHWLRKSLFALRRRLRRACEP
jgi:HEAT repeat protein